MTFYTTYQQASTYSAAVDRKMQQAELIATSRAGTPARPGVVPQTDDKAFQVTSVGAMNLQVAAGSAVVGPDYRVLSDAVVTLTPDVGGATARTDLIVLRVYETESGDTSNKTQVEIVKGTTTADPTVPARSLTLAAISVIANAVSITGSNITDRRVYTTTQGGILIADPSAIGSQPTGSAAYDPAVDKLYIRASTTSNLNVSITKPYITIPPASGYQGHGGYPPKARLEGSRCFLEGVILANSGNLVSGATIANLPVGYRPNVLTGVSFMGFGGATAVWARVKINSNGVVIVDCFAGTPTNVAFDGMSFAVEN